MDHLRNFSHIVPPFDMYSHHQPPPFMSAYPSNPNWDTNKSPSSPKSSSQSSPNPNPSSSYTTATNPWTLPSMNSLTQPLALPNNYNDTSSPAPPNTTITSASSSYYSLSDANPNIYSHNSNLIEPLASHPLTQVLKNKAKQNSSSFQLYESSSTTTQNGFYSETN